jgi:hypothetical protein
MNGGDFKCAACALDTFPLRFEVSIRISLVACMEGRAGQ